MHLLLLPGMDGTGRLFQPLIRFLPQAITPIVVAYPTDRVLGYPELFALVEAKVPAGQDFVVLGESFSGPLAVQLAARKPAGLRGLILCASFLRSPVPRLLSRARGLLHPLTLQAVPWAWMRFFLLGSGTGPIAGEVRDVIASVPPEVLAARARMVLDVDVTQAFKACPVPVLYLKAARDRLIPGSCAAVLRQLRSEARIEDLDAPHLLLQTVPQQAGTVLATFLRSLSGPETNAPEA